MSDSTETDAIAQAMASPAFSQDPYPLYAKLREEQPLYRSPQGIAHLSRYADVDAALRDLRLSNDRDRLARSLAGGQGVGETLSRLMRKLGRVMTNTDPPDHARLRKLVNKAFSAGRVRDFRPAIQAIADELQFKLTQRRPPLQDHIAAVGAAFLQVIRLTYPGNSRTHDDDVKMLGHRSLRIPVIRFCGETNPNRLNSPANISAVRPTRPPSPSR